MLKDNKKYEDELMELKELKLYYDKLLLKLEAIIGISTIVFFVIIVFLAAFTEISEDVSLMIVLTSAIFIVIMCLIMLKIEQVAGYYECNKCHHKYIPSYNMVLWAMHINRTRYMRCPKCAKYSWNRKVLQKDDK